MFKSVKHSFAALLMLVLIVPMIVACGSTGSTDTPADTNTNTAPVAEAPTAAPVAEAPTAMADEPTAMADEPTAMAEKPTAESSAGDGAMVELPVVDPSQVTGDFTAAGSSTVFPLTQRMVERFREDGYAGNPAVDSIGSGAGIERFCNGETDIANASRAMKKEEIEKCQSISIDPIEFRVGTDAVTVVVNEQNDFLTDLTFEQLAVIFSGEAKTWADVDPSYPAEPIQLFSPGSDSGTFDFFAEKVFDEDYKADKKQAYAKILEAPGVQLSENDNVLVQGVEGSPYAIGYFGFAYFNENRGKLKALSIGGVEPNEGTAESGDYKLSRPLFIYSAKSIMDAKPQVASFINYYLSNVNEEIKDVGYFPASEEAINAAKEKWTEAAGQS